MKKQFRILKIMYLNHKEKVEEIIFLDKILKKYYYNNQKSIKIIYLCKKLIQKYNQLQLLNKIRQLKFNL